MSDLEVLLTPREFGGHESALFAWLADAVRDDGLRPRLRLPPSLHAAARAHGLDEGLLAEPVRSASDALAALRPSRLPLLLAPGVLHAQAWLTAAAVLGPRPVWLYVPMVWRASTMGYRHAALRDLALAPWLRRAAGFIVIDDAQAALLREVWRVRGEVLTLPNRARLQGPPPPQPAPARDGRLRVGYVGRFDPHQKGLDWLAEALRRDRRLTEGCRWHFQGRGPAEPLLQDLAAALGPQQVTLAPHGPLQQALARVDLLLLPSRYEGLPLVALEATAQGWPVVASQRAGLGEVLPRESLFAFGDVSGLLRALQSLADPSARHAAVAHARSRLRQRLPEQGYVDSRRAVSMRLRRQPCGP